MTDASSAQLPVTANFINPPTLHHPAGYTHVVEVTAGRPVYIAGQVALDPTGALVGPNDSRAQARQVFDNLQAALQAVGAGFEQVRDDLLIEVEAVAVVASFQPMTVTA
jgi:enamine deaminase RidA (YjgF/YER057c/UK114 family)